MTISARSEAIAIAQQKLDLTPIYLDTETTGIDKTSEIIEIAIIDHTGTTIFHSLVKPSRPIPADVIKIHGITNEMVKDAPSWYNVWPEVYRLVQGKVIGIYNAEYDQRLILQTNGRYGLSSSLETNANTFCIMKLFAQYYGEWDRGRSAYRWQSLDSARMHCNIPIPNSHRALEDARLARGVLHHMAGRSYE